jgi:peptide-methionine (S)-S-oxide reductase
VTLSNTRHRRHTVASLIVSLTPLAAFSVHGPAFAADRTVPLPPPHLDALAGTRGETDTAVLSGGCFWGIQGVFQHVAGVKQVLAGYSGGAKSTASYEAVSTGTTGHAESVQIKYDPAKISYGEILRIFFSVALDPTQVDRQGPDSGAQYRSEIFYENETQRHIATSYIEQLDTAHVFDKQIATRVDPNKGFYPAEAYHQDYLINHPNSLYIVFNDLPKVEKLKFLFPEKYTRDPIKVFAASGLAE